MSAPVSADPLEAGLVSPSHERKLSLRTGTAVVPELLWSEATSVLHEAAWRGRLSSDLAGEALALVATAPIAPRRPSGLRERAWEIADSLGWATTHNAEYCAWPSFSAAIS